MAHEPASAPATEPTPELADAARRARLLRPISVFAWIVLITHIVFAVVRLFVIAVQAMTYQDINRPAEMPFDSYGQPYNMNDPWVMMQMSEARELRQASGIEEAGTALLMCIFGGLLAVVASLTADWLIIFRKQLGLLIGQIAVVFIAIAAAGEAMLWWVGYSHPGSSFEDQVAVFVAASLFILRVGFLVVYIGVLWNLGQRWPKPGFQLSGDDEASAAAN